MWNRFNKVVILKILVVPVLVFSVASVPAQGSEDAWKSSFDAGEAALNKGALREAEQKFRESLAVVRKGSGGSSAEKLCLKRLAATLALEDKTREARAIYQKLLSRTTREYGQNHPEVEPYLMALGSIEESAGNHPLAMTYYNRALKINERNYGAYSPAYANTLSRLGRVNHRLGKNNAAQIQYKRAISILSKQPNLAAASQLKSIMHEYGDLIKSNDHSNSDLIDDFDKDIGGGEDGKIEIDEKSEIDGNSSRETGWRSSDSKPLREQVKREVVLDSGGLSLRPPIESKKDSKDRLSGSGSADGSQYEKLTARRMDKFGDRQTDVNQKIALRGISPAEMATSLEPAYEAVNKSVFNQKRYSINEQQYKRKIAIDLDALGANHPSVGNDLTGLAQLYIAQNEAEKAKPLLEKALKIYDSTYGADNLLAINTRILLAQVEFQLGEYDRATGYYQEALSQGQKSPGTLETARVLNGLAYLYFHQGKLQKSSELYRWALSSTESAAGSEDPLVAACLKDYALVLREMGRDEEAQKMELRAGAILAKSN